MRCVPIDGILGIGDGRGWIGMLRRRLFPYKDVLANPVRLGLVDVAVLEVRAVEDRELADEVLWRGWDPARRGCDPLQLWNTQCEFRRI